MILMGIFKDMYPTTPQYCTEEAYKTLLWFV